MLLKLKCLPCGLYNVVRIEGFALAAVILVLGVVIPEVVKRRRRAELKRRIAELEKEPSETTSEVTLLRRELALLRSNVRDVSMSITGTIWQAEAAFCAILVAVISALL